MVNTEPLRIVHVLRAPMGGLFRHVRDLARAHEAEGHKVAIICDASGTRGYDEDGVAAMESALSLGVKRVRMRREVGPADIFDARKILKIIKELQPDVLHGHGAKGGVYARALGSLVRVERSRVARLYSPHGGSLHYDPRSKSGRVYFLVERLLERLTDHIIFVADYEHRVYAEKIGEPACSWSVNYNGLQDEEFEPVAPAENAADFLFLGELRMLKGPDIFLEAIADLRRKGHDAVRAVMVGDGPDAAAITALVRELGLEGAVEIRPPMPARIAFALARVFVMPSRAEALPYVVLEALAAGMPAIVTRVGGIPEILGADCPALVSADRPGLAAMMNLALTEPDRLGGWMPDRETMRNRFSARVMAANALDTYRRALTLRKKGRENASLSSVF